MEGEVQAAAENYFLQTNYLNKRVIQDIIHVRESYEDAWNTLTPNEREQAINDEIIKPEVVLKHPVQPEIKSFPRLRVKSGQKLILEEDVKTGHQMHYRDEHSAPFSWKTRSQQDLHVDLTPQTYSQDEMNNAGLQLVSARRSAILSCPFGQYSKIPKSAKPVAIPTVPHSFNKVVSNPHDTPTMTESGQVIESNTNGGDGTDTYGQNGHELTGYSEGSASVTGNGQVGTSSNGQVEMTNEEVCSASLMASSIVVANQEDMNSLVLDFSKPLLSSGDDSSTDRSTPREESTLYGRMKDIKDKTMSLKRSLTPTMRRRKSNVSICTGSTVLSDCTLDTSAASTPTRPVVRSVSCNRPSVPPPPPPPTQTSNPTAMEVNSRSSEVRRSTEGIMSRPAEVIPRPAGPPPPPTRNPETRISSSRPPSPTATGVAIQSSTTTGTAAAEESSQAEESDYGTSGGVHIPKTGFDFLDDW